MAIIIGADKAGQELKEVIKDYLKEGKYEVVDVSENEVRDFVDTTLAVAKEVNASEDNLGIVIDAYGVGSFMVATKIKGMVAAEVSDERSAYMTRGHNNSRIITLGSEISAPGIANNIVKGFVEGKYDGGRHQVRVDMLNKMC
ncbi:galactose-6-phosphate isomerase, LacA subunit [Streptococcus pyogenes]|uniref:galactose-6-phosphate isomerase subunit LacA n=1 Tax=Streptococcus pyogenes TaxID=1314 RepID=UPI00109C33AB|nr:galactose-6-phosphate isomerase subunit LacA [Streptococcus pyogenes]VGV49810.1 galactose-6-phosphate isomerase, LacA subunit [Streptococcus pyogenes]VHA87096.1 galactose-6-phosphate isomerase, LacA subunit [Streptococcus pyogenes]VHC69944.1 galactose-6-phosphate isomerase, LacA subunit [Streptococcus pyogenes]VHD22262.1 galactose-6-phosphate isomerase, LacA subunit [Streptococcus pyogenes]VHD50647.1 galactose-6-phosphate isomerase, LacA subunit [Streptococcus pyogenes]